MGAHEDVGEEDNCNRQVVEIVDVSRNACYGAEFLEQT